MATLEASSKPRPKWLKFRALDDDDQTIRRNAERTGLSVSRYMRQMCRNGKIVVANDKTDIALVQELNSIGVNLNQIARKFNSIGERPPDRLFTVLEVLEATLKKALTQ